MYCLIVSLFSHASSDLHLIKTPSSASFLTALLPSETSKGLFNSYIDPLYSSLIVAGSQVQIATPVDVEAPATV